MLVLSAPPSAALPGEASGILMATRSLGSGAPGKPAKTEGPAAFKESAAPEGEAPVSEKEPAVFSGENVIGVEVSKALTLSDIIGKVSDRKIVYAGERHDRYEDHLVQYEIIKALSKSGKIAIGMEMFQKPFQKALDDYIEGRTNEREFLKASQYFKRWGFDYNLYKDILRFAREEKIPVVALNIRKEIVEKVSKKGIDALSEEDKKELPVSMDMTDEDYKRRIKESFERHASKDEMNFDYFYQAQLTWDETMAETIDGYMKANPDRRMVVMAGQGHLAFGSGIPGRAFRRNGLDYSIIISDENIEKDIADFVLYPKAAKGPSAPRLGVILRDEDNRVKIVGFAHDSSAEKAGLREDDVIEAVDAETVGSADDVRIALFYKKQGDTVTVDVLRKRFLFGDRKLRFEVSL
jgi:aminopeptidase N